MIYPSRLHMPRPVPAPDYPDPQTHDWTDCHSCLNNRPKHRLRRFQHRLWICAVCQAAWYTERDHCTEAAVWFWRVWAK